MRTLSATLEAAQQSKDPKGIVKLVLTSGTAVAGFLGGWRPDASTTRHRILGLSHTEQPRNYRIVGVMDDSDNFFQTLDYKGYTAKLGWGYHTDVARSAWAAASTYALNDVVIASAANGLQYICTVAGTAAASEPSWPTAIGATVADSAVTWECHGYQGDEYSPVAPQKVIDMQIASSPGNLTATLSAIGKINIMAQEMASEEYIASSASTATLKDIIIGTAAGTAYGFPVYDGITLNWDSEDALIDSLQPKDSYRTSEKGMSRLASISWCTNWTKEVFRWGDDDKLHFLNPTVSGTAYNTTYAISTNHPFLAKAYSNPIVRPNSFGIRNYENTIAGGANHASTGQIYYWDRSIFPVTSTAQADTLCQAVIQRAEIDSQSGNITVPLMNVGQEVWDYVAVTDAREGGTTRTGNVQTIKRAYKSGKFGMGLGFGGSGNLPPSSRFAGAGVGEGWTGINWQAQWVPSDKPDFYGQYGYWVYPDLDAPTVDKKQNVTMELLAAYLGPVQENILTIYNDLQNVIGGAEGTNTIFDKIEVREDCIVPILPDADSESASKKYVDDLTGTAVAAGTVQAETTLGISSAAGSSTKYSRGDHTHGSPAAASTADIDGGSSTTTVITADGFAGAKFGKRVIEIKIVDDATALSTGDGKAIVVIPAELDGFNLVDADAMVSTVSTSGLPTYQIRNVTDSVDMLSTKITIDANEFTSYTAATASVANTANDDVATGDRIAVDKDVAGTGEKGDTIVLVFQLP